MKKMISDNLALLLRDFNDYAIGQGAKDNYVDCMGNVIEEAIIFVKVYQTKLYVTFGCKAAMVFSGAEQVISKSLRDDMKKNIFYKDIYQNVKSKVELFAELHGKSEVISKQLSLE